MAYPYEHKNRVQAKQVLNNALSGTISGTSVFPISLPPSGYAIGMTVEIAAMDQDVLLTAAPYVDHYQTYTNGAFKFLQTGGTTAAVTVTFAATATGKVGWCGVLVPAGDQYGAAAPVVTVHGTQVTLGSTATTGTFKIAYTAVEI